jgi:hypothetical protein
VAEPAHSVIMLAYLLIAARNIVQQLLTLWGLKKRILYFIYFTILSPCL